MAEQKETDPKPETTKRQRGPEKEVRTRGTWTIRNDPAPALRKPVRRTRRDRPRS
jgi:hypothetical protein